MTAPGLSQTVAGHSWMWHAGDQQTADLVNCSDRMWGRAISGMCARGWASDAVIIILNRSTHAVT